MKFVLKVLVLAVLVVLSKLAQEQSIALHIPDGAGQPEFFTQNLEASKPIEVKQAPVSIHFEKTSLHLN
jgi:hypothetical protein